MLGITIRIGAAYDDITLNMKGYRPERFDRAQARKDNKFKQINGIHKKIVALYTPVNGQA